MKQQSLHASRRGARTLMWLLALAPIAIAGLAGASSASASPTAVRGADHGAKASRCSLSVIEAIAGESAAADEKRTASWSLLRANGWTVFVPNSDWHLSASSVGADVLSPDGRSDASLAAWYSLSPWTMTSLGDKILAGVSDISVLCRSPLERSAAGSTQASELTGVYEGEHIHAVVILSLLTETSSGEFTGETRSLYTPVSQWSTANETALMLIIKRAILSPSAP